MQGAYADSRPCRDDASHGLQGNLGEFDLPPGNLLQAPDCLMMFCACGVLFSLIRTSGKVSSSVFIHKTGTSCTG